MQRSTDFDGNRFGLPANFAAKNSLLNINLPKVRSNSLNSLSSFSRNNVHNTSSSSSLGSLNLPKKRSNSYNQLAHVPSLSSIQEEDGKHLKWGYVEEFGWNSDADSKASSSTRQSDDEDGDYADDDDTEDGEDDDDGWGWFPEENTDTPPTSPSRAAVAKRRSFSEPDDDMASTVALSATSPNNAAIAAAGGKTPKSTRTRSSILRSFGSPQPLVPMEPPQANTHNSSLLILGTKHWPSQRQSTNKRRRGGILAQSTYLPPSLPVAREDEQHNNARKHSLLKCLVLEARAKKYPLAMSTLYVWMRGMGTGYVMRAVPNAFFRLVSWFYSTEVESNRGESLRTGLFLGCSMALLHVFALSNVSEEEEDEEEDEEFLDEDEERQTRIPWIPVCSLMITPLLAVLPAKSRLSMALYLSARATEAGFNGAVSRLPPKLRSQLPLSQWLYSLGIAQIMYIWLFHRHALPTELASFLDQAASFKMDLRKTPSMVDQVLGTLWRGTEREPLVKRILFGSGLFEFIASDVFSAASLFGPVFDVRSSSLIRTTLVQSARVALVLVLSAIFSRVGVVALSRLLHRFSPMNGYWAGFVAGLVAIQFEFQDARRIELAMYALTFAIRAVFNLAAERNIVPNQVRFGEFFMYFCSLNMVLNAANHSQQQHHRKSWFVLGSTFRTLLRRCLVP